MRDQPRLPRRRDLPQQQVHRPVPGGEPLRCGGDLLREATHGAVQVSRGHGREPLRGVLPRGVQGQQGLPAGTSGRFLFGKVFSAFSPFLSALS